MIETFIPIKKKTKMARIWVKIDYRLQFEDKKTIILYKIMEDKYYSNFQYVELFKSSS